MPTYLRLMIILSLTLLLAGCIGAPITTLEPLMPHHTQLDADFDLEDYRWENRLLLIFAPTADDDRLEEQMTLFGALQDGNDERDLLIVQVLGDDPIEAAQSLRERYSVGPDAFGVLLIGKDGGLKNRFDEPVTAGEVFGLIDAMPMRIREMREDGE